MNHGLTKQDIQTIRDIFSRYPEISLVRLYGSRAKGTHHQGSDIDLVIMDAVVSDDTLFRLKDDFDDSYLPFFVDIAVYKHLKEPTLKSHIDKYGKVVYNKNTSAISV